MSGLVRLSPLCSRTHLTHMGKYSARLLGWPTSGFPLHGAQVISTPTSQRQAQSFGSSSRSSLTFQKSFSDSTKSRNSPVSLSLSAQSTARNSCHTSKSSLLETLEISFE